jgi:hypothetical protein
MLSLKALFMFSSRVVDPWCYNHSVDDIKHDLLDIFPDMCYECLMP